MTQLAPSYTAEDFKDLLLRLSPPGAGFGPGGRWESLLEAVSQELSRHHDRCLDMVDETSPATASETLSAWEYMLGITDPQTAEADRQVEAHARLLATGGCTPDYFTELALALGVVITITSPVSTGWNPGSPIGYPFWSTGARFIWLVSAPSGTTTPRRTALENLFTAIKPAHTRVWFEYV